MDMFDLGWLVALLEGEGSFFIDKSRGYIYISIAMIDEDVINKLPKITGIGTLRNYQQNGSKRMYKWTASKQKEVAELMLKVYPYMGLRKQEEIKKALKAWRTRLEDRVAFLPKEMREEYCNMISIKFTET